MVIFKNFVLHQHNLIKSDTPLRTIRGLRTTPCLDKIISFNLSDIGEGIREVTIKEWYVKVGDTVAQFDNLCEVQSDKASVTITSRYDGKITKIHSSVDEVAYVGKALLDFEVDDEDSETSDSEKDEAKVEKEGEETQTIDFSGLHKVLTTPAVRRLAMENRLDLSKVPGTGRDGRVLKGDVLEYLGQIPRGTNVPHPTTAFKTQEINEQNATRTVGAFTADRTEKIRGVQKAMLKSMNESMKIPHFAYCDEVNMTELIEFRNQLKDGAARERGISKLTFMPFFIKAASIALMKYPILNSTLDEEKETLIYRSSHNITVAIDTPQGLVVPNIKECHRKNIFEIAKDLNVLVEKGRSGSLAPSDFTDGTFTLSNIGVIGGTYTKPRILMPQVAIGGIGRTTAVPRFNHKDELVKAYVMNISWVADHRVIDGVTIASFSNVWKQYLEHPALFLLHQ